MDDKTNTTTYTDPQVEVSGQTFNPYPTSIKDPELRDLNRHERRKYISIQRKAMKSAIREVMRLHKR